MRKWLAAVSNLSLNNRLGNQKDFKKYICSLFFFWYHTNNQKWIMVFFSVVDGNYWMSRYQKEFYSIFLPRWDVKGPILIENLRLNFPYFLNCEGCEGREPSSGSGRSFMSCCCPCDWRIHRLFLCVHHWRNAWTHLLYIYPASKHGFIRRGLLVLWTLWGN